MTVDENLLKSLIDFTKSGSLEFLLHLKDNSYPLTNVQVTHSSIPVNEPTTRGEVVIFNSPNSVLGPSIFLVRRGTTERSLIVPFILYANLSEKIHPTTSCRFIYRNR